MIPKETEFNKFDRWAKKSTCFDPIPRQNKGDTIMNENAVEMEKVIKKQLYETCPTSLDALAVSCSVLSETVFRSIVALDNFDHQKEFFFDFMKGLKQIMDDTYDQAIGKK